MKPLYDVLIIGGGMIGSGHSQGNVQIPAEDWGSGEKLRCLL